MVTLRHTHDLPVFDATRAAREGDVTLEGTSTLLGVSPSLVRTLITRRLLPARQVVAMAPWVIRAADLANDAVQQYVRAVRAGRPLPPTPDPTQLSLTPSTT